MSRINEIQVLDDVKVFNNILAQKYGIKMKPVAVRNGYGFMGEFLSIMGVRMIINIQITEYKTFIAVQTMDRQCVYQKSYVTNGELSKTVGLFNFIEKAYKTM